jgi:hypothetical protein
MAYNFISLSPNEAIAVNLITYSIFMLLIFFYVQSGSFKTANPVVVYAIPLLTLFVLSGAVGVNWFNYLFEKSNGEWISKKQMILGLVGIIVGAIFAFILSRGGLSIVDLEATIPVSLQIFNSSQITFSQSFTLFLEILVVAFSEEAYVILLYKNFAYAFASKMGIDGAKTLALIFASFMFATLHWASYGVEGIPLLTGVIFAFIFSLLVIRGLSFLIFGDYDYIFTVFAHFGYDFTLLSILPLSLIPVHFV